jgi:hypothetical protein
LVVAFLELAIKVFTRQVLQCLNLAVQSPLLASKSEAHIHRLSMFNGIHQGLQKVAQTKDLASQR